MPLLFLLLIIFALGVGIALFTGLIHDGLRPPVTTRPFRSLPEGTVTSADVESATFTPSLRGYNMAEVDEMITAISAQLAAYEQKPAVEPTVGHNKNPRDSDER